MSQGIGRDKHTNHLADNRLQDSFPSRRWYWSVLINLIVIAFPLIAGRPASKIQVVFPAALREKHHASVEREILKIVEGLKG